MIPELHEVVTRQRDAAGQVEARLRAIELLLAAGEPRFLSLAVDDAIDASDRLAALELTRSLALVGARADVTATDLEAEMEQDEAMSFRSVVTDLRHTVERIAVQRERVRRLLEAAHLDAERRLAISGVAELV